MKINNCILPVTNNAYKNLIHIQVDNIINFDVDKIILEKLITKYNKTIPTIYSPNVIISLYTVNVYPNWNIIALEFMKDGYEVTV